MAKQDEKPQEEVVEGQGDFPKKEYVNCRGGMAMDCFEFEADQYGRELIQLVLSKTDEIVSSKEGILIGEIKGIPGQHGNKTADLYARTTVRRYENSLDDMLHSQEFLNQGIIVLKESYPSLHILKSDEKLDKKKAKKVGRMMRSNMYTYEGKKKVYLIPPDEVKRVFELVFTVESDKDTLGAHYYTSTQRVPNISCENVIVRIYLRPISVSQENLATISKMVKPQGISKVTEGIRRKIGRTR